MKLILNYFLRGMLIVFPVGATIYLVSITINWVNATFNNLFFGWFEWNIPGLGILTGFVLISLVGFIFSRAFIKPIIQWFENILTRTPLVSIIYTSLKDLTEAFVGEKKKFTKPVKIQFGEMDLARFGFITQESLSNLGLEQEVAVYCPHSYNFSGNLYIVPKESITPIEADSTDFMRFIVSGGVTGFGK
ncbi:MAG: DUF502 domain-containing protein [Balneola sp.]|nr:MAG: DUF502 domain-containing protein [Balneola sp.]